MLKEEYIVKGSKLIFGGNVKPDVHVTKIKVTRDELAELVLGRPLAEIEKSSCRLVQTMDDKMHWELFVTRDVPEGRHGGGV